MRDDVQQFTAPGGQTLLQLIGGRRQLPAVIQADGELVDRERWGDVVPLESVRIVRAPQGDVGRVLGTLAVIAVAAWAGPAAAAAMGFKAGSTGFAVASAAVSATATAVGTLTLNALIPPALPSPGSDVGGSVERLATLNALSNQVRPFAPIPVLYGRRTYYPPVPMTALPFTELVGRDQYLRALFVLGYGPMDIGGQTVGAGEPVLTEATSLTGDAIKIGGTAIDQFDDVEYEIGEAGDLELYTDTIDEQAVGVALNAQTTPTTFEAYETDGNSVTRTTAADADEFSVELFSPALFTITADGDTVWAGVTFRVEYSPAGAGTWTTADAAWNIRQRERRAVRVGRRYLLPSRGQYDIRVTRVQTYYQRIAVTQTDFTWTVLRTITRNRRPFDVPDVVCMAIRIRATDQLSGALDRLSVTATRRLQTWTGSAWVSAATRSPAWAYVDILTGAATKNPKSLADVDATALKSWADWCDTNGLRYDAVLTQGSTVFERVREAAAAGLGSWAIQDDGTIGVVRDVPGQTPRMLISPRVSSGFGMEKRFQRLPHALRVQFLDDATGEPVERIVYDDGFDASSAARFEQLQLRGVTDPDQAWKLGRYFLAAARLRPETYRWTHDLQHLVYTRGDLVELTHDTLLVGLAFGRLTDVTGASVTLDEPVTLESGKTYAIRHQNRAGTIETRTVSSPASGTVTELTLASALTSAAAGDHVTFGESGAVTLLARVSNVRPSGDLRAEVEAVPAAENIFDAWTGTIPTFDPVLTTPVDEQLIAPAAPSIRQITSGSDAGGAGTGRIQSELVLVEVNVPAGLVGVTLEGRYRIRETPTGGGGEFVSEWALFGAGTPSDAGSLELRELEAGQIVDVQVRTRRAGRPSPWSATVTHTVASSDGIGVADLTDAGQLLANASMNPGFELGALGWDLSNDAEIVVDPTNARHGAKAARLTNAESSDNVTGILYVAEGTRVLVESHIKKTAGPGGGRVRISWYDAAGAFVASNTGNTVTSATYAQSRVMAAAPAGAVEARCRVLYPDGIDNTTVLWADDCFYGIVPRDADIDALGLLNAPSEAAATAGVIDTGAASTDTDVTNSDHTAWTLGEETTLVLAASRTVRVQFFGMLRAGSSTTFAQCRCVVDDGTTVTEVGDLSSHNFFINGTSITPMLYVYQDVLAAGTYTFRWQFRQVSGGLSITASSRVVTAEVVR